MNDTKLKIINSVRYATISTVDTNNNPWAAPVWYVYDDETIYWWSPIESQHSKNIEHNPNVYVTIFDSTVAEGDGLGVYISVVASTVKETHSEWKATIGKDGKPHNDTTLRKFTDKDEKYLNRWDLLIS